MISMIDKSQLANVHQLMNSSQSLSIMGKDLSDLHVNSLIAFYFLVKQDDSFILDSKKRARTRKFPMTAGSWTVGQMQMCK